MKEMQQLLAYLGGTANIKSYRHCATRLRITVYQTARLNKSQLSAVSDCKGVNLQGNELQLIYGTGLVHEKFQAFEQVVETAESVAPETESGQEKSTGFAGYRLKSDKLATKQLLNLERKEPRTWREGVHQVRESLRQFMQAFGEVFLPIIPVLVATGVFMGLREWLERPEMIHLLGVLPESMNQEVVLFIKILTDTAFSYLPALVAWSSFKVFGGSPVLGIVLGLMLVNSALPNAFDVAAGKASAAYFLGVIPMVGYQGTVLPAFIAGAVGAKLEQVIRKKIPNSLDLLVTPFLTLVSMLILSLLVIGPLFHSLETVILVLFEWFLALPYGLSGLVIGFTNQLVVVTGIHHIFNFLEIQLVSTTHANPFNAIITCSIAAQGGAALGVGVKTKSKALKALAFPSAFSALLGITEPALFGINLRFGTPFVMGLIGGAVGGFCSSLFHLAGTGMSIIGIPGALLYLNGQLGKYVLVNLISLGVAFGLTFCFGYQDSPVKQVAERS